MPIIPSAVATPIGPALMYNLDHGEVLAFRRGEHLFCYIWDQMEAAQMPGPRAPWALLFDGRRWVPWAVFDEVGPWAPSGDELAADPQGTDKMLEAMTALVYPRVKG